MYFSIIVPIFKVEKYLHQCIESILNQTYKDYELILVDDGSPDECPRICDEYAIKHPNVKVIHKANGGLSDARNHGVSVAVGEYVIFLDSDDYWDDNYALETLYALIFDTECDVLTWRSKKYHESNGTIESAGKNIPKNASISEIFLGNNFNSSACCKAIRKSLFEDFDLRFRIGTLSEDVEWTARLISVANNIVPSNLDFYVYRQRQGSITHSISSKNINDLKSHIDSITSLIDRTSGEKKEFLLLYRAVEFTNLFVTISRYSRYIDEVIWLKERKELLKFAHLTRGKILRAMIACLGVKNSLVLIGKIR